jgi:hypothetical protein
MKTLAHVRTETALHVLAYNMKRVMRILDVGGLIEGKDFFYGIMVQGVVPVRAREKRRR